MSFSATSAPGRPPEQKHWQVRLGGLGFGSAVAGFAWLRFTENSADNDLWGHVLYGERAALLGGVERVDTLSWTAAGHPWINHEAWAERLLGLVHSAGGSTALWILMVAMAVVTVGWATLSGRGRETGQRWAALGLLGASVNFIAMGYAVRPQLFTMLALVALLFCLRRFLEGRLAWGCALPPIIAVWVNLHGGFLAGLVVLLIAAVSEILSHVFPDLTRVLHCAPPPWRPGWRRIAGFVLVAFLAVSLNPWGFDLLRWTIQSVRLPRPDITEWQPVGFSLASIPFWVVLIVSVAAWAVSRRPRRLWAAAVLAVLAAMAVLHRRHAPLFGLANLMFTPAHVFDAVDRFLERMPTLVKIARASAARVLLGLAGLGVFVGCLGSSVAAPRGHPFAIEVPRDTYPVAAIAFIRDNALTGNTITFFDWGQEVLWELPDNPVSFDGRLDTVYDEAVMDAHWDLFHGRRLQPALALDRARVALLPTESGGVDLLHHVGWATVYRDPLATVLVKSAGEFPALRGRRLPVLAGPEATAGREKFPDAPARLATAGRPR